MAHFAKIENNVVTQVIVIGNDDIKNLDFPESEKLGQEYISSIGLQGEWIQTSYNGNFRKNFAGAEYTYDRKKDVFIPPQPYTSWSLDKNLVWQAPKPIPTDSEFYHWDESRLMWIKD